MPKRKDIVDNDSDDAVETPDELEEKQKKKAKVCGQKNCSSLVSLMVMEDQSDRQKASVRRQRERGRRASYKEEENGEGCGYHSFVLTSCLTMIQSASKSSESGPTSVKANSDGEKYLDLGKKKRVTVRSFKGVSV